LLSSSIAIENARVHATLFTPSFKRIRFYEVRPRSDKRGVDLISDALPFR
jgi:hypothetical protein